MVLAVVGVELPQRVLIGHLVGEEVSGVLQLHAVEADAEYRIPEPFRAARELVKTGGQRRLPRRHEGGSGAVGRHLPGVGGGDAGLALVRCQDRHVLTS